MASPLWLALPVTLAPAMGLLWLMLRRYEGYFEDARVFFSLVAGFFTGIVAAFLEVQFGFADSGFVDAAGLATAFFLFVAGNAFFEGGAKTMVLGLARFRRRKDTPYYAVPFGLGFGAMMAMSLVMANLLGPERAGLPAYTLPSFLSMSGLFLGGLLAHGGSTVWVGKGSADGKLVKGWMQGAALQAPILVLYWLFWPSLGNGSVVLWGTALASLAYGSFVLALADRRILATIVPPEIRDQVLKERRREQRRESRE